MKHEQLHPADELEKPIPELQPIAGWKEVRLQPSTEPLVPLGMFQDSIFTSSVYAAEYDDSPYTEESELEASIIVPFVRESVAKKLFHAEQLLPKGYHLVVYDAYRPLAVQGALYKQYYDKLAELHTDWTEEQLSTETQKYVSVPSTNPERPSPHNTGGAVDLAIFELPPDIEEQVVAIDERLHELKSHLTKDYADYTAEEEANSPLLIEYYLLHMKRAGIVKTHAKVLDFGTDFDNGTETSALRYYEELAEKRPLTNEENEAARNRRLLYTIMTEVGMVPYADEWWHYNAPESQMGAKVSGREVATFGAMELDKSAQKFAEMRAMHRKNFRLIADKLKDGIRFRSPILSNILFEVNEQAATGPMQNPEQSVLPKAVKIAPESEQAA